MINRRNLFFTSAFSLAIYCFIPPVAIADNIKVKEWLTKMSTAFKQQNYDGIFVYSSGANVNTMRVIHAVNDGIGHERLIPLDGPPHELIRQGDKVTCLVPKSEKKHMPCPVGSFADTFDWDINSLDNYQLKASGNGTIAKHQAIKLDIRPTDQYRYGYRLWLDKKTGFLLKSVCLDRTNNILEHFQFTQLSLGHEIDPKHLEPEIENPKIFRFNQPSSKAIGISNQKNDRWQVDWLPAGFSLIGSNSGKRSGEMIFMYSDGLSNFSIFIKPFKGKKITDKVKQKGATAIVIRSIDSNKDKYLVTVVGGIPILTAKQVSSSIKPIE